MGNVFMYILRILAPGCTQIHTHTHIHTHIPCLMTTGHLEVCIKCNQISRYSKILILNSKIRIRYAIKKEPDKANA